MFACFTFGSSVVNLIYLKQLVLLYIHKLSTISINRFGNPAIQLHVSAVVLAVPLVILSAKMFINRRQNLPSKFIPRYLFRKIIYTHLPCLGVESQCFRDRKPLPPQSIFVDKAQNEMGLQALALQTIKQVRNTRLTQLMELLHQSVL